MLLWTSVVMERKSLQGHARPMPGAQAEKTKQRRARNTVNMFHDYRMILLSGDKARIEEKFLSEGSKPMKLLRDDLHWRVGIGRDWIRRWAILTEDRTRTAEVIAGRTHRPVRTPLRSNAEIRRDHAHIRRREAPATAAPRAAPTDGQLARLARQVESVLRQLRGGARVKKADAAAHAAFEGTNDAIRKAVVARVHATDQDDLEEVIKAGVRALVPRARRREMISPVGMAEVTRRVAALHEANARRAIEDCGQRIAMAAVAAAARESGDGYPVETEEDGLDGIGLESLMNRETNEEAHHRAWGERFAQAQTGSAYEGW
jgi:hypothetical protein